jgi:hypothetical protein
MSVDKSNRPIGRARSRFYRVRKLGYRVEEARGIMREPMANTILRGAHALPPEFEARARQATSGSWLAQGAASRPGRGRQRPWLTFPRNPQIGNGNSVLIVALESRHPMAHCSRVSRPDKVARWRVQPCKQE